MINAMDMKKKKRIVLVVFIIVFFAVLICITVIRAYYAKETTHTYNRAVKKFNESAELYNKTVSMSAVYNIEGLPETIGMISKVDESLGSVLLSIIKGNSKRKIEKDIDTIHKMADEIRIWINIADQIKAPSEDFVLSRLDNVDIIGTAMPVKGNNDPNKMLYREGGYKTCIYFSVNGLDVSSVPGNNEIERGTDGGGAIEVYDSLEDAIERCEYLSEFDGTVLYTGSYTLIGTMVIRTSFLLTDQEQMELTDLIIREFTRLE